MSEYVLILLLLLNNIRLDIKFKIGSYFVFSMLKIFFLCLLASIAADEKSNVSLSLFVVNFSSPFGNLHG